MPKILQLDMFIDEKPTLQKKEKNTPWKGTLSIMLMLMDAGKIIFNIFFLTSN